MVAAPGTQAMIQMLSRIVPARRAGILGHTYGEHALCWRAAGAEVVAVDSVSELRSFEVGVVVDPNNPDGRVLPAELLAETARAMARRGGVLIVDEAFMDVLDPSASLLPRFPDAGAIVLRSFGKIFGLGGLRLGFAATSPAFAVTLRQAIGPWAVSGPAIVVGSRALRDTAWRAASVARLRGEAKRLDGLLLDAGFAIVGGHAVVPARRAQGRRRLVRASVPRRHPDPSVPCEAVMAALRHSGRARRMAASGGGAAIARKAGVTGKRRR